MKSRTFKSLPTYGELASGMFKKPLCNHSHNNVIWTKGKAWEQCLLCGKKWKFK